MRIKVSSAKAKGRNLQKLVANSIGELLGLESGYDDDHLIQPRPMGQSGTDIILRGQAKEKFPFAIECKSTESFRLNETIEQAKSNTKSDQEWLIVHKNKKLSKPVVILNLDCFMNIYKKLLSLKVDSNE